MQTEFDFGKIESVEFCVNLRINRDTRTSFLVPIDVTVQDALKQVLIATLDRSQIPPFRPGSAGAPAFDRP
jgi:hypothetical protein